MFGARSGVIGKLLNIGRRARPVTDASALAAQAQSTRWVERGRSLVAEGETAAALHAFKRALRQSPASGKAAYEIAKIMYRAKRWAPAGLFATRAIQGGVRSHNVYAIAVRASLVLRDPPAALAQIEACESLLGLNDDLRALRAQALVMSDHQRAARDRKSEPPIRHIAIGGHSHTGSTLLGALLGSLEGVAHAGETGELIYRVVPVDGAYPLIDFAVDSDDAIAHCRTCGPACEVLTRSFRASLAADVAGFYAKVGRRLGARVVVSSDKFVTDYATRDPLSDFDLIILYKPLVGWIRSYARRAFEDRPDPTGAERAALIAEWLDHWVATYESLLRDVRPTGRTVVVNWEAFVEAPAAHFERLVALLGLRGNAGVFQRVRPGHYVGGNATNNVQKVMREGVIVFQQSGAPALSAPEERMVWVHGRARAVFRRLESVYRVNFANLPLDQSDANAGMVPPPGLEPGTSRSTI